MADNIKNNKVDNDNVETVMQSEEEIQKGIRQAAKGPYLVIAEGPRQGVRFPLNQGDNAIGRAMGSEVLLEDQSVSRQHSIVTASPEGLLVEDLGSKNGTYVNGQRLSEKVTIGHGDVIQVGIYSLRLITKDISKEEAAKPLPSDWEGRTVMVSAKQEEDTSTLAENAEDSNEETLSPEDSELSISEDTAPKIKDDEIGVKTEERKVLKKSKKGQRPAFRTLVMIGILVLVLIIGGTYAYFKFVHKKGGDTSKIEKIVDDQKQVKDLKNIDNKQIKDTTDQKDQNGSTDQQGQTDVTDTADHKTQVEDATSKPADVPIFLDFVSSPMAAVVSFDGKEYGLTPKKVQLQLKVDENYVAEAVFELTELGEKVTEKVNFTVKRTDTVIPILFRGQIGVLKVIELPKEAELYLEGYFIYDPFNSKPARLGNIVFGKPVYVPYGKYIVELKAPRELSGSGSFVKDIRYKREILINENNPVYELKISEKNLNEFPVEIISKPNGADVFFDGRKVGETPYKGIFELGEHTLSLRKDGYFEYKQDLKMDMNVVFKTEIDLKTTVAGGFVNEAKLLMQKGRYQEAINSLTELFKNNPSLGEIAQSRYLIGSCFVHLGDLTTAEGYFKQAVEDEAMRYPAMLGLVSVYHGLGKKELAIPNLVEVLMNAKDEVVKREATALFLQISPLKSMMYIVSDPAGAKVYLNDKLLNDVTPMILPELSLGNYKVRIEKDGFEPQNLSINMSVSEFNPVLAKLKPLPE